MKDLRWILLVLLASATALSVIPTKIDCQGTELQVSAYPTTLRAGYDTSVSITIVNNFEPVYDVDASLSFVALATSTSPTVIGISNWKLDEIDVGKNVTIKPLIFAPADLAGNVYSASILISYKRLGYISPSTETHTMGFYVQGEIKMVAYDFSVDPDPVPSGNTVAIGASLLNKGNVAAMFTNVTLVSNRILVLKPESRSYLGEVDPNSPSPFTLEATIRPETGPGSYTVKLRVEYQDKESVTHAFERDVTVNVAEPQQQQPSGYPAPLIGILQMMIPVILAIIIIVVFVRRRRRKGSRSEEF